ncbi:MAG: cytochrome c oxidase, cbb3-type, subunit [Pseudomonadota bacterium]|jgi:cytochrome c oxidase cbb3-type subunit 3
MTTFWSLWIIVLTSACIILVTWVLLSNRKAAVHPGLDPDDKTTGHVYDGIVEYNNPLPRWWFVMFIISIIFAAGYLVLYPGMGSWKGTLGWTSVNELHADQEAGKTAYASSYDRYKTMSIPELAKNEEAMQMGFRLFANNCSVCHGADGGGNYGFPNLTDADWLHGGSAEKILETITKGRIAAMPAWGSALGEEKVIQVAEYVLKLSGNEFEAAQAEQGAKVFADNCVVCHGADGKGQHATGAPNLTDKTWLFEGSRENIRQTIRSGRNNQMPAQANQLLPEKIHLLAAYVYSLSQTTAK